MCVFENNHQVQIQRVSDWWYLVLPSLTIARIVKYVCYQYVCTLRDTINCLDDFQSCRILKILKKSILLSMPKLFGRAETLSTNRLQTNNLNLIKICVDAMLK